MDRIGRPDRRRVWKGKSEEVWQITTIYYRGRVRREERDPEIDTPSMDIMDHACMTAETAPAGKGHRDAERVRLCMRTR
jgi:phosphoribosylaminoimidazole-succinocarboxamide synthase